MSEDIIEPFPKQEELLKHVLNEETRVIVYGGGIRGGKSFSAILGALLYLRKWPGARCAIVRDSLPTLKRNTIPTYNKIIPDYLIKSRNQVEQLTVLTNNSQILLFPENYDHDKELYRWRGLEVNMFILEEGNELQEASFNKAIERVGSYIIPAMDKQPPPKIVITCNPSFGWLKERMYDKWYFGDLPKGWVYIPALITDNPHIPEEYKENLKFLPDHDYDVFVRGNWEALRVENPFADHFIPKKHISDDIVFNPDFDIYLAFDFNVTNTCLVFQYSDKWIHCIKEYHVKTWDLQRLCSEIKSDYPESFIMVNGDASGANQSGLTSGNVSAYDQIKQFLKLTWNQFRVPAANPSHLNSRLTTNIILKNENIKVHSSCKELIKDLQSVKVDAKGSLDPYKKKNPGRSHWLDPFRYHIQAQHYERLKKYGLENIGE